MHSLERIRSFGALVGQSTMVFARDVGHGMLEVGHNSLAAVGLVVVAVMMFFAGNVELRRDIETQAYDWLHLRHEARADVVEPDPNLLASIDEPDAVARATAANPDTLTRQQAAVAQWISRRYRVAPEPIARLVQEAWTIGQRAGLEPTLILAIMAIESSFNPFAQSSVGAQGLMQVMTKIHDDKYEPFGGNHAAFDPVTNLRVGVQVLKECISRAGGLQEGLKYYVGAANLMDDGGYAGRVLNEQTYLKSVADGKNVPWTAPSFVRPPPSLSTQAPAPAVALSASAPGAETSTDSTKPAIDATEEPSTPAKVALLAK